MSKSNIHILTALWQRPEITRICFEGIKRLGFPATASISEESYIPLCEEYGINWVMTQNRPLGNKWNTGMMEALKREWEYVMILGSDDLISDSVLDLYKPLIGSYYMFGGDTCHFYYEGKVVRYKDDRERIRMSVGAGRMIHRSVVEECMPLWDRVNAGLDGSALRKIRYHGYDEQIVKLKDAVILDIKSDINIHRFDEFKGEQVDTGEVLSHFSDRERELLEML